MGTFDLGMIHQTKKGNFGDFKTDYNYTLNPRLSNIVHSEFWIIRWGTRRKKTKFPRGYTVNKQKQGFTILYYLY